MGFGPSTAGGTVGTSMLGQDSTAEADEEARWKAESDARTLADAEEIMQDPGRVTSAKKAAKKLAEERDAEAQAMNAVAGREGDIEKAVRNGGAVMGAIPLSHYRR